MGDTRSEIGSEAAKMQYANTINNLVVKFSRLEYNEGIDAEMLVMERIFPIDFRSYEVEIRELWLGVFEYELQELHLRGFVHRHLKRPSNLRGLAFDNILLTQSGLRLIDVGNSVMKNQVEEKIFEKYIEVEMNEMKEFREYFLNR